MTAHLDVTSPLHIHYQFDFDWRSLFLLLRLWHCVWPHFTGASSCIGEWRTTFGIISRFDTDATSSWWISQTSRGASSCWSWTPSSLVLSYFFPNFHTLVILLQVDPASGDELEIVYKGCYEIEDTFIFAWSLVFDIGHYHWLHRPICRLPLKSKAEYLVRTIWHILNFLQLWTVTMA
jgi:hypothetical protein